MTERVDYDKLWAKEWIELQRIGPLTRTLQRLVIKLIRPYVFEQAELLDVGCGNASLLARLAEEFPTLRLTGIEGSEQAISQAPAVVRDKIKHGDLNNGFEFIDKKFDIITCTEVLEHLKEYRQALSSIAAHVKDKGCVLITVPHSMRYWTQADEFAAHYRRFEYDEFLTDLKTCGLKPVLYFTWGFPFGYVYYKLVTKADPSKLMESDESLIKQLAASLAYNLMRVDDLFTGKQWHQLIVIARKAEAI